MKITIIGTGYVGLVSAACLSEVGNNVLCLDTNPTKINSLINGKTPIYEPNLDSMIQRNITADRLHFTTDIEKSVNWSEIQIVAVGTPMDQDGSSDIQHVICAAKNIAKHMSSQKIVVIKSTVPVGTAEKTCEIMLNEIAIRCQKFKIHTVSNPEFLKEGDAINDFMNPDRIIIGTDDKYAKKIMRKIYAPFNRNHGRMIFMNTRSAELTKYASNCMLATRISFMNELANLAEKLDADIESVRLGVGSDSRIGYHFLYAGCGYGGSCLPKDIRALIHIGETVNLSMAILRSVNTVNLEQKKLILTQIEQRFSKNLTGKHFALWGLSFKPNTDDMREAPSRVIIEGLLQMQATICVYDPVAMKETQRIYCNERNIYYANTAVSALKKADALIIVTEWKEFRTIEFSEIKSFLKNPIIFDGRNLYSLKQAKEAGFEYYAVGIKTQNRETPTNNAQLLPCLEQYGSNSNLPTYS